MRKMLATLALTILSIAPSGAAVALEKRKSKWWGGFESLKDVHAVIGEKERNISKMIGKTFIVRLANAPKYASDLIVEQGRALVKIIAIEKWQRSDVPEGAPVPDEPIARAVIVAIIAPPTPSAQKTVPAVGDYVSVVD